jgi:hypothetical protein
MRSNFSDIYSVFIWEDYLMMVLKELITLNGRVYSRKKQDINPDEVSWNSKKVTE